MREISGLVLPAVVGEDSKFPHLTLVVREHRIESMHIGVVHQ